MAMIGSLIDKLDNWSTVIHVEIQLYLATKEFINKTSKFKRVIFLLMIKTYSPCLFCPNKNISKYHFD